MRAFGLNSTQSIGGLLGYREKNKALFSSWVQHQKASPFSPVFDFAAFEQDRVFLDSVLPVRLEKNDGVKVLSWQQALDDVSLGVEKILASESKAKTRETAFVNAFFNSGFVLVVEKTPVLPVEWTLESAPGRIFKILIIIKKKVTNFQWVERLKGSDSFFLTQTVVCEPDSSAFGLRLFDLSRDSFVHSETVLGQNAKGVFSNGFLNVTKLKNTVSNNLVGRGSSVHQADFCFGSDSEVFDLQLVNNHVSENAFSRCVFKAVLDQTSRCGFDGMILIQKNAQQSDALLECHGLLRSEKSSANLVPGLEILADDVKATHSASVSHLDDDSLFYLESRGIPKAIGEQMITYGFLESVLKPLPMALQSAALDELNKKILLEEEVV